MERFDTIAVEDLDTKDMVQGSHLAESIHDAAWAQFTSILEHKAEEAGAKVVRVEPHGTSQQCSRCGNVVPKTLRDRTHNCPTCGLILDRDHNAAINIQQRARAGPAWTAATGAAG